MGSGSSATRRSTASGNQQRPMRSYARKRAPVPSVDTLVEQLPFPANNADDYQTALTLHGTYPELVSSFEGMHLFVENILKYEETEEWEWDALDDLVETKLDVPFRMHYKDRKAFGQYLGLLKAAGAMTKAYSAALKAKGCSVFTAQTVKLHSADSNMVFLIGMRSIFLNYTDAHPLFSERLMEGDLCWHFVEDLKSSSADMSDFESGADDCFTVSIGTLYNCARNPATRMKLRELDTVAVILPYLKCKSEQVRMLTLLALAYMLDDDQKHLLLADDSVFDLLLKTLQEATESPVRQSNGYSVEELLEGATGLAKNDYNKLLLVQKGILPMLLDILTKHSDKDEEVERAIKCVWELSFAKKNKKQFAENSKLMACLDKYKMSAESKIGKAAAGALWVLQLREPETSKSTKVSGKKSGHIMISYQWADQKLLIQLKEHLRDSEFNVWMDIDNMGGSTLQAMGEAVENAEVVLVCMSERYKESQNCRTEAEYAFCLKKTIVPLLMERDYRPDGWLGMIKGTKLFFDFSGKYEMKKKLDDLVRELGERGKNGGGGGVGTDHIDGNIKTVAAPVVKSTPADVARGPGPAQWSINDVHNWLVKHHMERHKELGCLTGEDLLFLKKLSYKAPEFFYSYINDDLGMNELKDIRRFSEAPEFFYSYINNDLEMKEVKDIRRFSEAIEKLN